jgi:hypothetical protein
MDKRTPLYLSFLYNDDDVTELLLQAGASVGLKDLDQKSVLDYMIDRQKQRFGFKSGKKPFSLFNWAYFGTKKTKSVKKSGPIGTEIEEKETVSTTFTTSDSLTINYEQGASSNGNSCCYSNIYNLLLLLFGGGRMLYTVNL